MFPAYNSCGSLELCLKPVACVPMARAQSFIHLLGQTSEHRVLGLCTRQCLADIEFLKLNLQAEEDGICASYNRDGRGV